MKNTVILGCLLSVSVIACSNSMPATDVPSVVVNSFKAKFPKATHVEWEKEGVHYEAEFDLGRVDHTAQITADGKITMLKKELANSKLPGAIQTTLKNKYNTYRTDDVELIEKDGATYYQVELESNGKADMKLVLLPAGSENPSMPFWD